MEFKKLKGLIIERCKNNNACNSEFKRILESKNKKELLSVIKDNFAWSYNKIIDVETLYLFGEKTCINIGIYYKGTIEKIENKYSIVLCGDVTVKMLGSSTVRTYHKISPELKGERFVPAGMFTHEVQQLIEGDIEAGSTLDYDLPFSVMKQLFEWHFDVFGWIDKGLAIDKTTLKQ